MVLGWQGIYFSTLSHIAYESQLIVASSLRGKKTCKRVKFMHDVCLIFMIFVWYPSKNIWQTSFHFDFFSLFSGIQSIPKKRSPEIEPRLLRSRPLMHPETPFAANGLGRLGGGKSMLASGIPQWVGRSLFRGETLLWNFLRGVKTRGFCLRGTFFSSPWNYLKKKVLQRNWFVNFFGCWLHTPNCIVMWWTKRFLIFLASNYLQRPPTQWWLTLLLRLHTSDVGVHVLPHLPSLEALRWSAMAPADPGVFASHKPRKRFVGRRRLPSDESFMNVGDLGKT